MRTAAVVAEEIARLEWFRVAVRRTDGGDVDESRGLPPFRIRAVPLTT